MARENGQVILDMPEKVRIDPDSNEMLESPTLSGDLAFCVDRR